jgi:hypothetical protein
VWIVLTGPGTQRTVNRFVRKLSPGETFHRSLTQSIPGSAAAGDYSLTGPAANSGTQASDSFDFEKLSRLP